MVMLKISAEISRLYRQKKRAPAGSGARIGHRERSDISFIGFQFHKFFQPPLLVSTKA